jgi:hypothetical protein
LRKEVRRGREMGGEGVRGMSDLGMEEREAELESVFRGRGK